MRGEAVTTATPPRSPFEAAVSAAAPSLTQRAAFEAFFATWFPRVYAFAAARLPYRAAAEAVTRAVLEAAVRGGLAGTSTPSAHRLLALARAEVARVAAAHAFVTGTPRASQ